MKKRRRRVVLPQGLFTAQVETLLTDGRGLAHEGDKVLMIDDALPDEEVLFEYKNKRQQILEGQAKQIVRASPFRVEPACDFFGQCGGCNLQHLQAGKQIEFKQQQLLGNLRKQAQIDLSPDSPVIQPPLTAKTLGYRHRARLGIKQVHAKERVLVGFRERYAPYIVDMNSCQVLTPALSTLIEPIAKLVANLSIPNKIPQVEVAHADNGIGLNFRILAALNDADYEQLSAFAKQHDVLLFLQPGNESTMVAFEHAKTLHYRLQLGEYAPLHLGFLPYHFTQVNFAINEKMLGQALDWLAVNETDVILDLFCGLGNFTLPMAQRAQQVVGVEGSKPLVDWAKQNAQLNGIDNAAFYQADLTQDTSMMSWRKQTYNKVVIDPPRSGAEEIMPFIAQLKPEKVLYVSCHPATLARDANVLVNQYGYRLKRVGVMDMFTHTAHVESMALFER